MYTNEQISDCRSKFEDEGYVIVNLEIDEDTIDQAVSDMDRINSSENKKLNPEIYHYNKHPRLIEGWKQSAAIKEIALNKGLKQLLSELYNREHPLPFSTINFTYGTEQPLHSDYFHFGSMPELMLAGVWVALEDIDPDAGPLSIVPGSHKSPIILPEDLGIRELPKTTKTIKQNYTKYEEWVVAYLEEENLTPTAPVLKKGQALIWAANMLHGAGRIKDDSKTRYSQVIHYHFTGCDFFYNPNFSTREKYVHRDVSSSLIS